MLFSTGKRTVVCQYLGQELEGNFCSPRQSISIKPLHPRSAGAGHSPGTLCTCLPTESARQVFWEPEPHPMYQSINGSPYLQRYFHIGNPAPVDVQLSPGMPAGNPWYWGLVWAALEPLGWIHLQPSAAEGSCCLMGFGYCLFKKVFLHPSVLHEA